MKLFPQGYSALALYPEYLKDEPSVLLIDIGEWTVDLIRLDHAVPNAIEIVSREKKVMAGLIQKLVDENATRKLDQYNYRKKYDGYASRYAALESRMDSLEKERERKEI